jgi:hypothetical protein
MMHKGIKMTNDLSLALLISVKRRNSGMGRLGRTTSNRGLAWVGRLARSYGAVVIRKNASSGLVGSDPKTSVVYRFPNQTSMLGFILTA